MGRASTRKTMKVGKKRFSLHKCFPTKREAKKVAKKSRADGYNARVVPMERFKYLRHARAGVGVSRYCVVRRRK